jgi:hypothetical protein
MRKRPDWRSPNYAEVLKDLDRSGFAWEFLRRNPAYRKDYDRISEDVDEGDPRADAACERWGLSFRM